VQADLVLYNGNIHTMDGASPQGRAIAIRRNRVLAVDGDAEIRSLLRPGGEAIDLGGHTVVPGFVDAHLHFASYGLSLKRVDLAGVATLEEALSRVADGAAATPAGRWVHGRGWDQSLWQGGAFPTRWDLDRVAPEHPVLLRQKSGHASWVNSRALELAGITAETADPAGGAIDHDPATGEPTGILKETAMGLVSDLLPDPSLDEVVAAIEAGTAHAHRLGLVGVHTMEGSLPFQAFQKLHAAGKLRLRVLMQIPEDNLEGAIQVGLRSGFGDPWLRIGGLKLFSDGALGSHTAYMLEPFDDAPDDCGIAVSTGEHLREVVGRAGRAGIASYIHAIGDRANRDALDAVEVSRAAGEGLHLRHRIEHVQLLHPDDLPRLTRLGVIASMQPVHATQDMLLAERCWGIRCATGYAWRSLLDSGAVVAFGSDAPVEDLSVMVGIHAAVTRRRPDGSPGPEGWYPEQRVTVEEAVYAYTAGAAYAGGEEAIKGTLSPDKLADLVVLSKDIFSIEPMAILETEVVATMVDGAFAYVRDGAL
jgi:predicted amidohydrolase YtcJ